MISDDKNTASHGDLIKPIPLHSNAADTRSDRKIKYLLPITGLLVSALLVLIIAYIFTAKTLLIEVEPEPDSVTLSGTIWPLKIKGRYLVQPGKYLLEVNRSGYHSIHEEIKVTKHQSQVLSFALQKKPGYLKISSIPKADVLILINGERYGVTPVKELKLDAGTY